MLRKRNLIPKLHLRKGDTVQILTGDDKGKRARVMEVFPKERKAIVEGMNLVTEHTKPNAKNPKGGIVKKEAPIHVSNLMVVDAKTNEPTRIGRRKVEAGEGKMIWKRYSKTTDELID